MDLTEKNKQCEDDIEREVILKDDEGETSEEAESQEKRSNNESNLENVSPGDKLPTDEELVGGNEPSQTSLATTVDEVIANVDEEKKKDEYIDLLGNGLLLKKIIKVGSNVDAKPVAGQEVCVKCEGQLPSGEKVDVKNELSFIVGDGDVITAFDLCIPTMSVKEVCELKVEPRFAYGSLGREDDEEGDIPPDSVVTYNLELLSVANGPDVSNLTDEQRIDIGDQKRERGNDLYRREEFSLAVYSYNRALKYLGSSNSKDIVELRIKCWNNISACHLKAKEYMAARNTCDLVLGVDPDNVKALFRKGKVLRLQGEYEDSFKILKKANDLDPSNNLIRELYIVRQKYEESRQKERTMYQRMVGCHGDDDDKPNDSNKKFFTWPVILTASIAVGVVVVAVIFARH
ncbi:peptidyl-prolyl cis-trans isomerase FKBP8-like isoform X2 [Xenia sp. Carnegie-2017]|uniref:peptidyl-prolyl cis-trans isomerase FKBP8-like isoform X2 n=1 Tax=Xenia sp. Carnegie-2017 TaxID=2897299 RepID=UPI001F045B2F|nr:peptidyl-prolyl cis-trans isomerase FKBP8-like isoform X2 [Xenia sp. Carnegie-2017]